MNSITKYWFLQDFDLIKKTGKKSLMTMSDLFEMRSVQKGEELTFSKINNQVVFFLKPGTIKIVDVETNKKLHLAKKVNIFGELALSENGDPHTEKVVVIEDGVICTIEADKMKRMMDNHPSLNNGIRIKRLQNQIKSLLFKDFKDSATRIREYIISYIEDFGDSSDAL